jgi:hypothetical protein
MNDFHNNNNTERNKIQEYLIMILGIRIACLIEKPKKRILWVFICVRKIFWFYDL